VTPEQLNAEFPLGPDSLPQPGTPRGRVEKFSFSSSRIFPGTVRDYHVYVPAQYDPAIPACVMVVQDGYAHLRPERRWQIPTTLDNLIHQRAIPACIGIFLEPGRIPSASAGGIPRENRSFEYDSLSDRYARFVLEEILPEVGRGYNLKTDGASRLIMGGSSGAFCAFHVAWLRPDAFQRVFSAVGSYTALRGGNTMAGLVRITEPRPIRIFLESGHQDFVIFAGNWWTANQDMLAALEYSGYEVNHAWAEHGGHNDYHPTFVFPAALRWLWQDYPRPIRAGVNSQQPVMKVLIPGEDWRPVAGDYASAGNLAANAQGEVCFASESDRRIYRIAAGGRVEAIASGVDGVTDLAFGPDGRLHACQPRLRRIVAFDGAGRMSVGLDGIEAQSVGLAANGNCYVADSSHGQIWLVTARGDRTVVDRSVPAPRCVRLAPDQAQLIVDGACGRMAHLFRIGPDGALDAGAPFFRLNLPDEATDSGAGQIAPHARGWTCFATTLGLQLADAGGAVSAIISHPGSEKISGVAFGGPDQQELHVACGGRVYRRKILAPADL
jgi:enterochelin esterase-like enzyme